MTITEVNYFLSVCRTGNISQAANNLYISQPALSRAIRSLEAEFGCTLFVRGRGKQFVELTEAGKKFRSIAERWQSLYSEAKNMSHMSTRILYAVSATDSMNAAILASVFQKLMLHIPNISLTIRSYLSAESYTLVENGSIDIALIAISRYSKFVESIPLFSEKMLFVCSAEQNYPDNILPQELDPTKEIRIPWSNEYDIWHSRWFSPFASPLLFIQHTNLVHEMLLTLDSWAILPASLAAPMIHTGKYRTCNIVNGPPNRIGYCIRGRNQNAQVDRLFLRLVHERICELDGLTSLVQSEIIA